MAEDEKSSNSEANGGEAAADAAATNAPAPSLKIVAQYLKDLSFENPNAPDTLKSGTPSPKVDIAVNVNAKTLAEGTYEVELHLEAKAQNDEKIAFVCEIHYAGMFQITNVPQESLHPIVLIECPRALFPFARQIMANATQQGGFPPLMLDPIDFAGMYQQRVAQQQQGGEAPKI